MTADPAPTALELHVLLDRLPGVTIPCLTCGGRGRIPFRTNLPVYLEQCALCGGSGEQPAGVARDMLEAVGEG